MGKFADQLAPKFADSDYREPQLSDFKDGTVAWLIQRFIEDTRAVPGMKQVGESQEYILSALQRYPIGAKRADSLRKSDIIDHCKMRRAMKTKRGTLVGAATVNQDVVYLRGVLKYAGAAWDDCSDISDASIAAAKAFLVKQNLIGKSSPRTRVPTAEEWDRLLAYFMERWERNKPGATGRNPKTINMVPLMLFAIISTRRIGEICRIRRSDIEWERKNPDTGAAEPMYMVRDMKHPRKKLGNHKRFALFPELASIINQQPIDPHDDRVFPVVSKSASAAYTMAKKELGIVDLRFHDNRREAITRWVRALKNPYLVRLISGHDTVQMIERVYNVADPSSIHALIAQLPTAEQKAA